jgi:hypothetical protein
MVMPPLPRGGRKGMERLSLARDMNGRNNADMTMKGHEAMGIKLTPRAFMELCLAENARRLGVTTSACCVRNSCREWCAWPSVYEVMDGDAMADQAKNR